MNTTLPDARLQQRLERMVELFSQKTEAGIPQACGRTPTGHRRHLYAVSPLWRCG